MIFEHYRSWMPKLHREHGKQLIGMLALGPNFRPKLSPKARPREAGGIEPVHEGNDGTPEDEESTT
jgi:hypothetical protein